MPAAIRKTAVVLAVPALMGTGVFAGSAAADPEVAPAAEATEGPEIIQSDSADSASCPAGFVCYYSGFNLTGAFCGWRNADRQHADECRWMGEGPARSIFNNGRDPAFAGVCSYRLPDFEGHAHYLPQRTWTNLPPQGDPNFWKRLSHRWTGVAGAC